MAVRRSTKWYIVLAVLGVIAVVLAIVLPLTLVNHSKDKDGDGVKAYVAPSAAPEPRLILESSISVASEPIELDDTDEDTNVPHAAVSSKHTRPRAEVYTRRDLTGCYGRVMRLRMPFHAIYLRDRCTSSPYSVCYGRPELPLASDLPPYVYDSIKPRLILAEMSDHLTGKEVEFDMACTARYLEMTFTLDSTDESYLTVVSEFTIRLNISSDGDGEMGDVLMLDEEDKVFKYFDADSMTFHESRPRNPVSFTPPGTYEQIKAMARHHAVPVPIEILNRLDASEITSSSLLEITLMPDTSIMFMRHPSQPPSPAWIMRHICLPELTRAISAVVHIL